MVVRLLPSRSVKERCFRRPCAITRVPFSSDSVTFSAASRQIEQRRNRASPSLHSFACRSNMRGVDAMVNDATAIPDCVKRSSGSAVRLPITVMTVSFAMGAPVLLVYGGMQVGHRYRVVRGGGRCYCEAPTKERHGRRPVEARGLSGSLLVEAHQLGAHHGLVEAELTVELLGGLGLRGEGQDDVDALGLLVDLVGELPLAPDVDVVDGAALGRDDLDELLEGPADGPLSDGRFGEADHCVLTNWASSSTRPSMSGPSAGPSRMTTISYLRMFWYPPPVVSAATVSPWQEGSCHPLGTSATHVTDRPSLPAGRVRGQDGA